MANLHIRYALSAQKRGIWFIFGLSGAVAASIWWRFSKRPSHWK